MGFLVFDDAVEGFEKKPLDLIDTITLVRILGCKGKEDIEHPNSFFDEESLSCIYDVFLNSGFAAKQYCEHLNAWFWSSDVSDYLSYVGKGSVTARLHTKGTLVVKSVLYSRMEKAHFKFPPEHIGKGDDDAHLAALYYLNTEFLDKHTDMFGSVNDYKRLIGDIPELILY